MQHYDCDWPQGLRHEGGLRFGDLSLCERHLPMAHQRMAMGLANALPCLICKDLGLCKACGCLNGKKV
jgi:hypothetical protein